MWTWSLEAWPSFRPSPGFLFSVHTTPPYPLCPRPHTATAPDTHSQLAHAVLPSGFQMQLQGRKLTWGRPLPQVQTCLCPFWVPRIKGFLQLHRARPQ